MSDYQARFQQLLRKLFQFDCADLDFGIYRIMNYKRAVIERFISKDLPRAMIEQGNSFHNDRFSDLKADYILANPPFNVSDWGGEHLREDKRWKYGIPPLRAIHTTFVEEALTWKMAN